MDTEVKYGTVVKKCLGCKKPFSVERTYVTYQPRVHSKDEFPNGVNETTSLVCSYRCACKYLGVEE